ncbi:hypothetical protein [Luteipulveratus halotolerans]|uniref:Uncharacterized protein n=1 Tax=Luteipulveratus halotolerans TaxID=1631356 RepID=A0A0L6CIC5_9MICO|nr:hypothetical protein [Luteipulveratus halotolerans]KNX37546.1 hypothetical protein VV01_10925 [Luteipulveratus halotolerans]
MTTLAVDHAVASPAGETAVPSPLALAQLTDEELVLMGAEHPVVVLPHYEQLSPAAQEVAVRTAHRSLLAHGVELGPDGRSLMMPQEISDLLDVRAGAEWVLVVRRVETVERDGEPVGVATELYAHAVAEFVLLEQVSGDGVHEFVALDRRSLPTVLAERLRADGTRDGAGAPIRLDLEAIAHGHGDVDLTQIGPLVLQVDATVWRRGPQNAPVLLGLMLGSQGSWATRAEFGAQGPVELQPIAADAAADLVVELFDQVTAARTR